METVVVMGEIMFRWLFEYYANAKQPSLLITWLLCVNGPPEGAFVSTSVGQLIVDKGTRSNFYN